MTMRLLMEGVGGGGRPQWQRRAPSDAARSSGAGRRDWVAWRRVAELAGRSGVLAAPEKGAKTNGPKQSETDATPGDGGCGRPPLTEPAAPARRAWRTREPPWHGARRRAAATSWRLRTGVQRRARGSAAGTRGADLARGRRHRPASAGQPASDLTCDM